MEHGTPSGRSQLIERHRVTDVAMVPTQLHRLMQLPEDVRATVRRVVAAPGDPRGRAVPIDLKRRLFDWLGPVIYEFYGATEGGGTMATARGVARAPGHGREAVAGRRRRRSSTTTATSCRPAPSAPCT